MFQKKSGRRWTWISPNCVTKSGIDYILTNRPDVVTNLTVINQVNVGSDHIMAMSNIKLDVLVEIKEATKSICHTQRIKEDRLPTRIGNPIRNTTIIIRHRQTERNHHIHNPTKRVKSS